MCVLVIVVVELMNWMTFTVLKKLLIHSLTYLLLSLHAFYRAHHRCQHHRMTTAYQINLFCCVRIHSKLVAVNLFHSCRILLLQICCDLLTKCALRSQLLKRDPVQVVNQPLAKKMLPMICHWNVHFVQLWHFQMIPVLEYVFMLYCHFCLQCVINAKHCILYL